MAPNVKSILSGHTSDNGIESRSPNPSNHCHRMITGSRGVRERKIELASRLGIPLSTTHTINTAIMGVGATRRFSAVRWGVTVRIVGGWILTFPCCAAISFITTKIVMWFE